MSEALTTQEAYALKLVNLSGRSINIATPDGKIVRNIGPSGRRAVRPALEMERPFDDEQPSAKFDIERIVRDTSITHMKDLPEPQPDTFYILGTSAAMAASFLFDRDDIITPDLGSSALRDHGGRVLAVTRFMRYVPGIERPAGGLSMSLASDND